MQRALSAPHCESGRRDARPSEAKVRAPSTVNTGCTGRAVTEWSIDGRRRVIASRYRVDPTLRGHDQRTPTGGAVHALAHASIDMK